LIFLPFDFLPFDFLPYISDPAEQCSQDRPPGSTTFSCQAITVGPALAAHSTQNRVQGRCVDFQEPQQRHSTDIPQSSHQGSRQ